VRDILAKSLGTTNPINMLKATVDGLKRLRRPEDVAAARGLTVSQVLPVGAKPDEDETPEATVQPSVPSSDEPAEDVAPEASQEAVTSTDEAAQDVAAEEPQETESGEDQDQASS
jgi:ribosomal S5-like protein